MRIFQCAPVNDIKCNLVVRIGKCAPVKSLLASNLPNNNAQCCSALIIDSKLIMLLDAIKTNQFLYFAKRMFYLELADHALHSI